MDTEDLCSFTTSDVKRVFLRNKKTCGKIFLLSCSAVILLYTAIAPTYRAEALFKQSSSLGGESELLQSFLQDTHFGKKETGVQALLHSRTLLEKVAQELGLCCVVQEGFSLNQWKNNVVDRCRSELKKPIPDRKKIYFSSAVFTNSAPLECILVPIEKKQLSVFDREGNLLATGSIGQPIQLPQGSFIVETIDPSFCGKKIFVQIQPIEETVKALQEHLKIKATKGDKNVLALSFVSPNARESAAFLNQLMKAYQSYLQQENEEISVAHLQYLASRQEELTQKYEKSLADHVAFLSKNVEDTGFISYRQERDFLEKPSEEYTDRIYDIDLRLGKMDSQKKKDRGSPLEKIMVARGERVQEIELVQQKGESKHSLKTTEGLTTELAEHLYGDYSQQWDRLRVEIGQLSSQIQQVNTPDFDISSLSSLLTDSISVELMQKAARISLDMQDRNNYSGKDVERLRGQLTLQKEFLLQHMSQLLKTKKAQSQLLKEKMASLQSSFAHLLGEEKQLLEEQLHTIQGKMKSLPEKWKQEQQLLMQRDLHLGMIQGLTQLTEAKNLRHRLFQVESKPIDWAHVPYKATRVYLLLQALLVGIVCSGGWFLCRFMQWVSQGRAITPSSARELGIAFCSFLKDSLHKSWELMREEDKTYLRKAAAFVFSHLGQDRGIVATVVLTQPSLTQHLLMLLHAKGLKVLMIDCTPAAVHEHAIVGLYDYLWENVPPTIKQEATCDRIFAGKYRECYTELLFREEFVALIEEQRKSYDVILPVVRGKATDPAVTPLLPLAEVCILEAEDAFYAEVSSWPLTAVLLAK